MGRNKNLNYADFGSSALTRPGVARGTNVNSNSGGQGGVFNRLGNHNNTNNNSFQALADSGSPAPGRIAFGGKANADQRNRGFGQSPQQHANSQQRFGPKQSQQQQANRHASQGSGQHQSSRQSLAQKSIADGISEHMNKAWPLSCFSAATEKVPELRNAANEINGDVSFEEVRWADYQEPNKQTCAARFNSACQAKLAQFQALKQSQTPPSQGGAAIPEPASPYLTQDAASTSMPNPFGKPAQPQHNPFGQGSNVHGQMSNPFEQRASGSFSSGQGSNRFAKASDFSGQASNPFGSTAAPSGPSTAPQQANQPGRIQFGAKARNQPASKQAPSQNPFQKPIQPTGDPFGRQRPAQAMQPPQQSGMQVPAQNPFGQQQQMPGTPAPFASLAGVQSRQQPGFGGSAAAFQTPAAQRPAFGGGVAVSLQTPATGSEGPVQSSASAITQQQAPDTADITQPNGQQASLSQGNPWTADEFEVGQIPEEPPPQVYRQA